MCELGFQGFPVGLLNPLHEWFSGEYQTCVSLSEYALFDSKWSSEGSHMEGAFVIVPEGFPWSQQSEKFNYKTFKWVLGFHPPTFSEIDANHSRLAPLAHELKTASFSVTARLLTNPISQFFHQERPVGNATMKQNLVLVDSDAFDVDTAWLQGELRRFPQLSDTQVVRFRGFARPAVPELYWRAKVVVDASISGYEGVYTESTLYETIPIIERSKVGSNRLDWPGVPSWAFFDRTNRYALLHSVAHALENYSQANREFSLFRFKWLHASPRFQHQVSLWFMARDVVFRTYCVTNMECRAAIALAISIWNNFPTATVEVFTPNKGYFLQATDTIRRILMYQLDYPYFEATEIDSLAAAMQAPLNRFSRKCTRFVVWIHNPFSLFLSPDTLLEHTDALVSQKLGCIENEFFVLFDLKTTPLSSQCSHRAPEYLSMDTALWSDQQQAWKFFITVSSTRMLDHRQKTRSKIDFVIKDLLDVLHSVPAYRAIEMLLPRSFQELLRAYPRSTEYDEYPID